MGKFCQKDPDGSSTVDPPNQSTQHGQASAESSLGGSKVREPETLGHIEIIVRDADPCPHPHHPQFFFFFFLKTEAESGNLNFESSEASVLY